MRALSLFALAGCGAGLLLCGCGSSASSGGSATSPLAGNWLIVGPMPTSGLNLSNGFRLAMTFDVTGNNIVATGFGDDACNGSLGYTFGFGSGVTGMVAADGSFKLQSSLGTSGLVRIAPVTMSVTGMVPKTSGSPWAGSYSVAFANNIPQTCDLSGSGTFTATSFPLVGGVYTGTASSTTSVNGVSTTTTMALQVTLQQGGSRTDPATGHTVTTNTALTGSIKVQGSPCFSSGTMGSVSPVGVLGNEVNAAFTMDDGSTLVLIGTLTDASEAKIATDIVLIQGGHCGGNGTFPAIYQMPELDRQS